MPSSMERMGSRLISVALACEQRTLQVQFQTKEEIPKKVRSMHADLQRWEQTER